MELYKGFIGEAFDTNVEIEENGVRYMVDVKDGQKTGSSSIRNTTEKRSSISAKMQKCSTALHTPDPLP